MKALLTLSPQNIMTSNTSTTILNIRPPAVQLKTYIDVNTLDSFTSSPTAFLNLGSQYRQGMLTDIVRGDGNGL